MDGGQIDGKDVKCDFATQRERPRPGGDRRDYRRTPPRRRSPPPRGGGGANNSNRVPLGRRSRSPR